MFSNFLRLHFNIAAAENGKPICFIFESMKFLIALLATVTFFIFISCKKSGSKDSTAPVITFIIPGANAYYAAGDTVTIRGTITDEKISSASIEIRNKTTNTVLYQQTSSAGNAAAYNFLWKWKNTVSALTPAAVKVVEIGRASC